MTPTLTPRQTLRIGRWTMLISLAVLLFASLVAYPLAHRFGLAMQIVGHLAMPVAAAFFKLGYVARLAAHHALGNYRAG